MPFLPDTNPQTLADRLQQIDHRLVLLNICDVGREAFGADTHDYMLNPPAEEARVAAFERETGVQLPEDYRAFITTIGDGGAGPFYGFAPLIPSEDAPRSFPQRQDAPEPDLSRPFPLSAGWNQGKDDTQPPIEPGSSVYDGALMLSQQGCGYFDMLIVSGPHRGQVWADFTEALAGLHPWYGSFLTAYECWLDRAFIDWSINALTRAFERPPEEVLSIVEPLLVEALEHIEAPRDPAWIDYPRGAHELLWALAHVYIGQQRPEDALARLDALSQNARDDSSAKAHLGRARVWASQGEFDRGLEAVEAGLAEERLWFATRIQLLREKCALLRELERDDEVIDVQREIASHASHDLHAQFDLAWSLIQQGALEEAAKVLIQAADLGLGCDPEASVEDQRLQTAGDLLEFLDEEMPEHAKALRTMLKVVPD